MSTQQPNQYPPNRDPSFRTSEAEKQVFEALDVEMDKWAKSIPEHREFPRFYYLDRLRDICAVKQISFGSSVDSEFVRQSIYLHTQYHKFKMWIRRPYTLPSRRSSPLAPASTAMCTKSATTCFHLLYKLRYQLGADLIHYEVSPSAFAGYKLPELTSLNLSEPGVRGGLHLSHQSVQSAPPGGYHPR